MSHPLSNPLPNPAPPVFAVLPPERRAERRLPDGRLLAWSEWGPPDAPPVLFCPGAGTSGALGFGEAALAPLGLRLVAIDRPGLGRSDPHPDKTLASFAGDAAEVLRHLGAPRAAAVGFSQGAPFALALAGLGAVRAVALVSPQDDLAHPAFAGRLHPDVAAMVEGARADPAAFEARFAALATADGMWDLVVHTSGERDRAVYTRPDFAAAFRAALREGFARGAAGYARDLANALRPWAVRPEDVTKPVDLWFGALDTSPVHSPDLGATLAARLARATLTVDPGEGGSILWTRGAEILARLRDRLA